MPNKKWLTHTASLLLLLKYFLKFQQVIHHYQIQFVKLSDLLSISSRKYLNDLFLPYVIFWKLIFYQHYVIYIKYFFIFIKITVDDLFIIKNYVLSTHSFY